MLLIRYFRVQMMWVGVVLAFFFQSAQALDWLASVVQNQVPVISGNSQYVVFEANSGASGNQLYLKNLLNNQIRVISNTRAGISGNARSFNPSISTDGRYVAFESISNNLVPGALNDQVYLKDTQTEELSLVSKESYPLPPTQYGPGINNFPVLSADASKIYFQSNSPGLVQNGDVLYRIYEKDRVSSVIRVVSTASDGHLANAASMMPGLDLSNQHLFFESTATNLVQGSSGYQIFRKDLQSQAIQLVSSNLAGEPADGSCGGASASADGNLVAFICNATNLVPKKIGTQMYLKDLTSGQIAWIAEGYSSPKLSPDGKSILFLDGSGNLFLKDLSKQTVNILMPATNGTLFQKPALSFDGKFAIFSALLPKLYSAVSLWRLPLDTH